MQLGGKKKRLEPKHPEQENRAGEIRRKSAVCLGWPKKYERRRDGWGTKASMKVCCELWVGHHVILPETPVELRVVWGYPTRVYLNVTVQSVN